MPHQNQFSFQNRGFLGGAIPQHQFGSPGLPQPLPFPGPGTGGRRRPLRTKPQPGTPFPPGFGPGPGGEVVPPFNPLPEEDSGDGGIFDDDFIKELFGEQPELAFFGALGNQNQNFTPIQREFFPTQFNQFQNRFFGRLGNLIQGGTSLGDLPNFSDFLGGINFQDEFRRLPPSLRPGGSTARFRPPTQFRF